MLTAMLTRYGTYVFNFLPMGCSCSGDLFEACIHELFSDLLEQGRMMNERIHLLSSRSVVYLEHYFYQLVSLY